MNSLLKVMKNDKTPILRNLIVLPLVLSPDFDEELARATENRVASLTHDITPDLLRTKPDPDVEIRQSQFETRALQVPPETAQKQINALNKVVGHVLDQVTHARDEWENEAHVRAAGAQTHNTADTHALMAAVGLGKNLKSVPVPPPAQQGEIFSLVLFVKVKPINVLQFQVVRDSPLAPVLPKPQASSRPISNQHLKFTLTTDKSISAIFLCIFSKQNEKYNET